MNVTDPRGGLEIRRLAYLEALGLDSYVSRRQLPGAAPSPRLQLARAAVALPGDSMPAADRAQERPLSQVADMLADTRPVSAPARPAAPSQRQENRADVPVFSLAATYAGGWYWLDEISAGRSVGTEYLQLIHAICHAMGLDTDAPVQEQFNWPLGGSGRLDQGVEAARASFSGFLNGRIERFQPRRVAVLGNPDPQWFDSALLPADAARISVSAWKMLREPSLKRQAWNELKALLGDAG